MFRVTDVPVFSIEVSAFLFSIMCMIEMLRSIESGIERLRFAFQTNTAEFILNDGHLLN